MGNDHPQGGPGGPPGAQGQMGPKDEWLMRQCQKLQEAKMQRDYQKVQHYEQKIMAAGYIRCQQFPGFKRAPFNMNGQPSMAGAGAAGPAAARVPGPAGGMGGQNAPPGSYQRVNPFATKTPTAPGGFGVYQQTRPVVSAPRPVRQPSFGERSQAREMARIQEEARKATARAVAAQQQAERNSAILRAQAQVFGRQQIAPKRIGYTPLGLTTKKKSKKKKKKRRKSRYSSSSSDGFSSDSSSSSSSSSYRQRRKRRKSKTKYATYAAPTATRSYASAYRSSAPSRPTYTAGKYKSSYTTSAYRPTAKQYPWKKN
jgi:hypothetical protein